MMRLLHLVTAIAAGALLGHAVRTLRQRVRSGRSADAPDWRHIFRGADQGPRL